MSNSLKVLISAYACEPHKGSEPGVGWYWANELASMGHYVWVITRANNRSCIEEELASNPRPNLNFVYYDLPEWAKWWKKGRRGIYLYYVLWQWGAYSIAKSLKQRVPFDVVHHVTFVSIRQPSFMGFLGIPFIFGPVSGGESTPRRLRRSYPFRGHLLDLMRDISNCTIRFDPFLRMTFSKAMKIYVTSKRTLDLVPKRFQHKASIHLAIGIESNKFKTTIGQTRMNPAILKILYVGQLLYLKGVHLALRAFTRLHEELPASQMTIIGSGPDQDWLKKKANSLSISTAINWIPLMEQAEVLKYYAQHDILLFPSLRDSGGMVILEAMANALPVVCLDLGGPGEIVDDTCGRAIETTGKNEAGVVSELARAMIDLAKNHEEWAKCSEGALKKAAFYQGSRVVEEVYSNLRNDRDLLLVK